MYGCEVWGYTDCDLIESVHLKYCKYVLNVKQSTPNCMIYGELGRLPLNIIIKKRMINYWTSLLTSKNMKLSVSMYKLLFKLHCEGIYSDKWLLFIKKELYSNGLGIVWEYQNTTSCQDVSIIYGERLHDQFLQHWYSDLDNNTKCYLYKEFKEFVFEQYLVHLPRSLVKYITKFRLSCTKLPIETGRYTNIDRELRFCNICNSNQIGDEYHLVFECTNVNIVNLRRKYLPAYYVDNAFRYKLIVLLRNVEHRKIGVAPGRFLKDAQIC